MAATASTEDALKRQFLGMTLDEVPTPSVVMDLAKLELNSKRMLDAVKRLDIGWRAHIKTHKTTELTRLQVGDSDSTPVNIAVSTLVEAENIVPLLKEYQSKGRAVNLLYCFPIYPSSITRLASVSRHLGPAGLSVIIDHADHLPLVTALSSQAGHPPLVFLKVDMGYHRAGTLPDTPACSALVSALLAAHATGKLVFHGLYTHAGHSYATREEWEAMSLLSIEFLALAKVAPQDHSLVLSVGATPTATTLQHPGFNPEEDNAAEDDTWSPLAPPTENIKTLFAELRAKNHALEVHAGVYPVLDLQQLATHARSARLLSAEDLALSVLCEVASVYPGRGREGSAEALVNAGTLAIGREPVATEKGGHRQRGYSGWGVVMPWRVGNSVPGPDFPEESAGWQVGRISQEHGILTWDGPREDQVELRVGQRIRIWPNHACVAGAGFGHYLIVDSRRQGREDEVVDVWARWNAW